MIRPADVPLTRWLKLKPDTRRMLLMKYGLAADPRQTTPPRSIRGDHG